MEMSFSGETHAVPVMGKNSDGGDKPSKQKYSECPCTSSNSGNLSRHKRAVHDHGTGCHSPADHG